MAGPKLEKFEKCDKGVIYSSGASNPVAHIPVDDGGLTSLCEIDNADPSFHMSSLKSFQRRRNPTLCKKCKVYLHLADGNVENALTAPSVLLKEFDGITIGQLLEGEISSGEVVGVPKKGTI